MWDELLLPLPWISAGFATILGDFLLNSLNLGVREMAKGGKIISAWLEVWRPAELLTVPGATLAGIALTGGLTGSAGWRIVAAVASSVLIFGASMLLNDWFDQKVDRCLHPMRPLPDSRLRPQTVLAAASLALLIAMGLAISVSSETAVLAFVICLLVVVYQAFGRYVIILGTMLRALRHALHLLLGATVMGIEGSQVQVAAVVLFICMGAVGWMAPRRVPRPASRLAILFFALTPLPVVFTGLNALSGPGCIGVWIALAIMSLNTIYIAIGVFLIRDPFKLAALVPWLYRHLILVHVFWVAVGSLSSCYWMVGILALWPISWRIARIMGKKEW